MQIISNGGPIYGTIIALATKNKFIDFRDALSLAYLEDYAMLKGIGGKRHAYTSGIRLVIQDNSGTSSVNTVNTIVPEYMFDIFEEVCKRNLCSPKPPKATARGTCFNGDDQLKQQIGTIYAAIGTLVRGGVQAARNIIKNKSDALAATGEVGSAIRASYDVFANPAAESGSSNPYADYYYSQSRVNVHKRDASGYCPVTSCVIKREQYRTDGNLSASPWSITISTYEAIPVEHENGTFSPNMKTMRNAAGVSGKSDTLFINLSDEQMWSAIHAVQHFIRVWETTCCTPLIRDGIKAKEEKLRTKTNN